VHIHTAWDPATRRAHALAGNRILLRGDERVGECVGHGFRPPPLAVAPRVSVEGRAEA